MVAVTDWAHRGDIEVELVAGPAGLHLGAARNMLARACGYCPRSGAAPRPCRGCGAGRRRWAGSLAGHWRPFGAFQARARGAMLRHQCIACSSPCARASRPPRSHSSPLSAQPALAVGTLRRPTSPRAGRARLSLLVSRRAVARRAGQVVQRLPDHRRGRRGGPDLAIAAHRDVLGGMRRPAVRNRADPANGRT